MYVSVQRKKYLVLRESYRENGKIRNTFLLYIGCKDDPDLLTKVAQKMKSLGCWSFENMERVLELTQDKVHELRRAES